MVSSLAIDRYITIIHKRYCITYNATQGIDRNLILYLYDSDNLQPMAIEFQCILSDFYYIDSIIIIDSISQDPEKRYISEDRECSLALRIRH
ncbi:MAG: hypothetical protein ACI304_09090 [Lepagella sp.]